MDVISQIDANVMTEVGSYSSARSSLNSPIAAIVSAILQFNSFI
jgi:hypothetical protein